MEFEGSGEVFARKLLAPFLAPDFPAVALAVLQHFDLKHMTGGIDGHGVINQFMFAEHLIEQQDAEQVGVAARDPKAVTQVGNF